MSSSCTVLIAPQSLLPALTVRVSAAGREVVAFADGDALRALEAITTRRPAIVALERLFASTPRGAALINRIKADPSLVRSEIRIIAHDVIEPLVAVDPAPAGRTGSTEAPIIEQPPLDTPGTRRRVRVVLTGAVDTTIDNNAATLVDLSPLGAQVVSPTVLKPNQRVRLALSDGRTTIRTTGTIVWARFEIPPGSGPRYRGGIEFVNPDGAAIDAFCRAHGR